MKTATAIRFLCVLCGLNLLCAGCAKDAAKDLDSPDMKKVFLGKAPATEEYKQKMADMMQKQKAWNEKMKTEGRAGTGAPQ